MKGLGTNNASYLRQLKCRWLNAQQLSEPLLSFLRSKTLLHIDGKHILQDCSDPLRNGVVCLREERFHRWVYDRWEYDRAVAPHMEEIVHGAGRPAELRDFHLPGFSELGDAVGSTDFDDVRIATPPPPGATVPGAPTGVSGLARDHAVALTWNAPSSDGGSPISGYRITPRIATGDTLDPVFTPYADTSYTVTGLTNGTAYTFTVAATNAAGSGPASAPSNAITPAAIDGTASTITRPSAFQ